MISEFYESSRCIFSYLRNEKLWFERSDGIISFKPINYTFTTIICNFLAKILDHRSRRYAWLKGGSITYTCDAEGYPAPVLSWVKDKVVIETGSNSLQLRNAQINDSGVYECWANNSNGFDARVYTLKVTSKQIRFHYNISFVGLLDSGWLKTCQLIINRYGDEPTQHMFPVIRHVVKYFSD